MKRILLILFAFQLTTIHAQLNPRFSGEGFTAFWNNPASYGALHSFSTNLIYKNQLEGNFQNLMFNTEKSLDFSAIEKFNGLSGGIGFAYLYNDVQISHSQMFKLPISIRKDFDLFQVSLGLAPSLKNISLKWFTPQAGQDPALPTSNSQTIFDLDAGFFANTDKFYFGISGTQLLENTYSELNQSNRRYCYVQAAYKFDVSKKIKLMPQARYVYVDGFQSLEGILYGMFWDEMLQIGLGLNGRNPLLGVGLQMKQQFRFAYNMEMYNSNLTNANNLSHEFRLSWLIHK